MSEIHYLGATMNQTQAATELRLPKPANQITDGELDLLLIKQRLEIEKVNSALVAGPFNFQQPKYDAALSIVNKCIANTHNPDVIAGIGQNIEAIGKKNGKKTAAGKLLQKVATGIKKGVKAITKVAAAPAKLVMEIYLPKAAPLFLYLFVPEKDCPDVMKVKRQKAVKIKNTVVNGMGMQEKHFMAIIRNSLTKLLKQSPESFLAAKLRKRESGISGIGKNGKPKATKKQLRAANNGKLPKLAKKAGKVATIKAKKPLQALRAATAMAPALAKRTAPNVDTSAPIINPVAPQKSFPTFDSNLLQNAANAITWILNLFKGNNEKVSVKDFADVEQDAANAFEWQDMENDYDNLTDVEKDDVKETATKLIVNKASEASIKKAIKHRVPKLTDEQVDEIMYEVKEGLEAIDYEEAVELATEIKKATVDTSAEGDLKKFKDTGGGTGTGACSC